MAATSLLSVPGNRLSGQSVRTQNGKLLAVCFKNTWFLKCVLLIFCRFTDLGLFFNFF